jgi:hypothetical protein
MRLCVILEAWVQLVLRRGGVRLIADFAKERHRIDNAS